MKKEFIPYEHALELKELGFDEPCFGWFASDGSLIIEYTTKTDFTLAPTYSQAFRWFREKYKLHACIEITIESKWYYSIYNLGAKRNAEIECEELYYDTYEDAELECINKLIQIVKQK